MFFELRGGFASVGYNHQQRQAETNWLAQWVEMP